MTRKEKLNQAKKSKYSKLFIREEYFKFIKGRYFCMKKFIGTFLISMLLIMAFFIGDSLVSWINIIKKSPTNFLYDSVGLLISVASIVLIVLAVLTIFNDMVD